MDLDLSSRIPKVRLVMCVDQMDEEFGQGGAREGRGTYRGDRWVNESTRDSVGRYGNRLYDLG